MVPLRFIGMPFSPLGGACETASQFANATTDSHEVRFLVGTSYTCNRLCAWLKDAPNVLETDTGGLSVDYTFDDDTATITAEWAPCGGLWLNLETTHVDPRAVLVAIMGDRGSLDTVVKNSTAFVTLHNHRR